MRPEKHCMLPRLSSVFWLFWLVFQIQSNSTLLNAWWFLQLSRYSKKSLSIIWSKCYAFSQFCSLLCYKASNLYLKRYLRCVENWLESCIVWSTVPLEILPATVTREWTTWLYSVHQDIDLPLYKPVLSCLLSMTFFLSTVQSTLTKLQLCLSSITLLFRRISLPNSQRLPFL